MPVRHFANRFARLIVVVGCGLSLALSVAAYAQDTTPLIEDSEYVQGVKAFAEGDFKTAADLWLADAYLGSADAQFNIGVLYVEGKGLPKDRGEAIFWFNKAANQGHREAQYNLGHLLLEETGDPDKVQKGIGWWRRSAEGGFPIAQFNYGRALFYGIGTDENREGAKSWFERAANGGNEKATAFLEQHRGKFVDAPPPVEISEPMAIRIDSPSLETAAAPTIQEVQGSEYVLVKDNPVLVFSRFNNFSPIVSRVDSRMLLRVVTRNKGWLQVEVPGGFSGWVANDKIKIEKELAEIVVPVASVHADPTESEEVNDIGELLSGSKVLLLEQQDDWSRVQLPEKIPGWIEQEGVRRVEAEPGEIAKVWQTQRIKQKLDMLASREIKVAEVQTESMSPASAPEAAVAEEPAPSTESYASTADPRQTIMVARTEINASSPAAVPEPEPASEPVPEAEPEAEPESKVEPSNVEPSIESVAVVTAQDDGVEQTPVADQPGAQNEMTNRDQVRVTLRTRGEDGEVAGTRIDNDNQWLFERTSKKYTLQLFSMQNRSSARGQLNSLGGRGQFFSTVVKGDRWYYVLLGKFLTEEAARAVVASLPGWARDARVRSLTRLQVNRCKKLALYNDEEARGLAELCR